ncbi:glycohydrolase toxin TNT-related protein [Embleya sp. NPDC001921]
MSVVDDNTRYEALIQRIGNALLDAAPQGWLRMDLGVSILGEIREHGLSVITDDQSTRSQKSPQDALDALVELRHLMHRAEQGTWFSARFMMNAPTEFNVWYNYDFEPTWMPPPSAEELAEDLQRFPRPPEKIPNWLRDRIGLEATEPATDGLDLIQQRDFGHKIAGFLASRVPSDWLQIRVYYRAAGDHVELYGFVHDLELESRPWSPPSEVAAMFDRLRSGMYKKGTGTWSGLLLFVTYPLRTQTVYSMEPVGWQEKPPRAAVLSELRRFPREPENIPDWMRAIAPDLAQPTESTTESPPDHKDHTSSSSDEKRALDHIRSTISEAGVNPRAYQVDGRIPDGWCLERIDDAWQVVEYERGLRRRGHLFSDVWGAGAHLLGELTITPVRIRMGMPDSTTSTALDAWPIQPLPGEPPLTLLRDKRVAVLMPGRRIVRYGGREGNLTFAGGTAFEATALPESPQVSAHFVVNNELRVLAGRVVPHRQFPGGGDAYLTPKSIDHHVAEGILTVVDAADT